MTLTREENKVGKVVALPGLHHALADCPGLWCCSGLRLLFDGAQVAEALAAAYASSDH